MRSTRWKAPGIILLCLLVLASATFLLLPRLIDLNRYKGFCVSQLENLLGGTATIGDLDWGISSGIWVQAEDLSVEGANAFPGDLELARLYARVSLLPLLKKQIHVDEILFDGPSATIRLLHTESNEEEAESEPTVDPSSGMDDGEPSPLPVEVFIEEFLVRDGRLRFEDSLTMPGRRIVQELTDVSIQGVDLKLGEQLTAELSMQNTAEPDHGTVKGKVIFGGLTEEFTLDDPRLMVQAGLTDIDVDVIDPYLGNESVPKRLEGSVSMEVSSQWDLGERFHAEGRIDLSGIRYSDPSMWEAPLPGKETTLDYRVSVDPLEVGIENLQLELGGISLSAKATLREWKEGAILQNAVFSSEIPLIEIIPLVPWNKVGEGEFVLRESLEEGGKITVKHAALPDFPLHQIPEHWREVLSKGECSIEILDASLKALPLMPGIEHIAGKLQLGGGVLEATEVSGRIGPLTLPTLSVKAKNLTGKPKVSATAGGPMRLVGSTDAHVNELLREYGLERLTADIETSIRAHYDHAMPNDWDVRANLVLKGVDADTLDGNVRFRDLRGRLNLQRNKSVEITVEGLRGDMNQSPIRLDGKLSKVGTKRLVVDGRARIQSLDLALASALHPPIEDLELNGSLDLNLAIYYPHANPMATRMNGEVKVRSVEFKLDKPSYRIRDAGADLVMAGNTVKVTNLTFTANDQELALTGEVSDLQNPHARLRVSSPALDLDRLLPPAVEGEPSSEPAVQGAKRELPALLGRLVAEVEADLQTGKYREQAFQNLKLNALYERGVLKSHKLDVEIGEGHVAVTGAADFRNLQKMSFDVQADVRSVPEEWVAVLVGLERSVATGPLSLSGRMQGETGSTDDLLKSLRGEMEWRVGPGRIQNVGPAGIAIFKLFRFLNVSTLLDRKLNVDLDTDGLPYDYSDAKLRVAEGTLDLDSFSLKSPAMDMECFGQADLPNRTLDLKASVGLLGTVDKALGYIPIAGGVGASVTKVYLKIHGPMDDPRIEYLPAKGVRKAVEGAVTAPGRAGKGVLEGVGKGLEKIF